ITGGRDIRPLLPGPILVVPGSQEYLVLLDDRRITRLGDIHAAGIAQVIPVLLQKTNHVVLGVHEPAAAAVIQRGVPWPVVGNLRGTFVGRRAPRWAVACARVQAVAALAVIGLPGLVVGLEQNVRMTRVIADDERNEAAIACARVVP